MGTADPRPPRASTSARPGRRHLPLVKPFDVLNPARALLVLLFNLAFIASATLLSLVAFMTGWPMTGAGHGTGVFIGASTPGLVLLPLASVLVLVTRRNKEFLVFSVIPILVNVGLLLVFIASSTDHEPTRIAFRSMKQEVVVYFVANALSNLFMTAPWAYFLFAGKQGTTS